MAGSILSFLKGLASSRLAQALFLIHLLLVVYDFSQKPVAHDIPCVTQPSSQSLVAARPFHYHYESALLKTLIVLDLPGLLLGMLFGVLLTPFAYIIQPCDYAGSWIVAGVFLAGTSIQWWFTGFLIEACIGRFRDQKPAGSIQLDT